MREFGGKLAVVTGGGSGMGRELVRQLVAQGCDVAMCDVSVTDMAETARLAEAEAPQGIVVSTFEADVSDEAWVSAFRDAVRERHRRDDINLLFNNAGIGGGGSFVDDAREDWEKTFDVCWGGVYHCTRAFMPMLVASSEGHIVNTSSVNGFWASLGPGTPHTAYSAAKFAVKGFTEALISDLRLHAPHVGVSLVMPGHVGTGIVMNSRRILGHNEPLELSVEEIQATRDRLAANGLPSDGMSNDELRQALHQRALDFRDNAPLTASDAAAIILDGVREGRWRILVGEDAKVLDRLVREAPETAYDAPFMVRLRLEAGWNIGS